MSPTPIPRPEWTAVPGLPPLTEREGVALAEGLPVTPYSAIACAGLRAGLDRAFVSGPLEAPNAVIVQHAGTPGEPEFVGGDPEAGWSLLSRIPGWFCLSGSTEAMTRFAQIFAREVPLPFRWLGDLFYTLERPPDPHPHPAVRLLNPADIPLMEGTGREFWVGGYRTYEDLLNDRAAAAGIMGGQIVAVSVSNYSNRRYADIGVRTLEPYRGQGLSTAATSLVAREVQARGLIPVWSTGSDNFASQRVATKIGFLPYGRGEYLVFDGLKETGGYRPV
ncbi:MAG: GNAT family N-acetyltransferase [Thermoplasmata archaeon]|nr:GNAT family N-acetyltransferase [Thermoplasmata archaeon]